MLVIHTQEHLTTQHFYFGLIMTKSISWIPALSSSTSGSSAFSSRSWSRSSKLLGWIRFLLCDVDDYNTDHDSIKPLLVGDDEKTAWSQREAAKSPGERSVVLLSFS